MIALQPLTVDDFDIGVLFEEDLPEVLALERSCYTEPWTAENFIGEFRRPITLALGCKLRGELAAHCFFWLMSPEVHLLNLAVSPQYRGLGLARCLLDNLINIGHRAGAKTVFLEVRLSNEVALALYQSYNFKISGRRPNYYENGEDAYLMTLELESEASQSDGA